MKTKSHIIIALTLLLSAFAIAQTSNSYSTIDSLKNFKTSYWTNYYYSHHTNSAELPEFIKSQKRDFIINTFFDTNQQSVSTQNRQSQLQCTNIDFENGDLSGWTKTRGFHPNYNPVGCCSSTGGAQAVISGLGLDACGGFPVVASGGNFSIRLGNNGIGGVADRIEQTFFVTQANANFTYKYAVVFEDPGHTIANQPNFQIEMRDTLGNQIPCTYYNVSAGQGISGFVNSTNCAGVIYKPWSNVSVDLTNYIGQNVTIQFTTQDCAFGGHYAYAYIDASCSNFNINQNTILCQGANVQLTAPTGFATYNWLFPNNTNLNTQIINTSMPGEYVLNLTTVTGCPGPRLTYTLTEFPNPISNFIPIQTSACSPNFTFTNSSSISQGFISSTTWGFGNGNTSSSTNGLQTYASTGTYSINLTSTSNMGCVNTVRVPVSVRDFPIVNFNSNTVCLNNTTSFVNNSTVNNGTILSYNWQFGDGGISSLNNPTHTYNASGNYVVNLIAISSFGCIRSQTISTTINPLPTVVFTATNNCLGFQTTYTNLSSISSGFITNYLWDYNSDGITDNTLANGNTLFSNAGNYASQLTAVSNFNCIASKTIALTIYPKPVITFSANSVCVGLATLFTNYSTISNGLISSYNWQFGDLTNASTTSPSHSYSSASIYNATLTGNSNFNCTNSIQGTVIVYPKPLVNFSSSIACLNQATGFNNGSSIASGSMSKYLWDFDNNGINDDSTISPTHVYPNSGNINSKLTAISNNNCANQTIKTVIVRANPVANFYSPSTCLPQTTNFTNASTSSDGMITGYNWDFNGDNIIDNILQNPNYIFSMVGNYGVRLEVQTQYGCVKSIIKSVYVNATPQVLFSAQNNKGCPLLCANFLNNSFIGSGNIKTYQWIFGDNSSANYTENPTHCYKTGSYNVTLKAVSDSGCLANSTLPNLITVYPEPIADFNITPTEVDITTPLIEVTDKSVGASTIKYLFNDGTVKSTPNFNHTFVTNDAKKVLILQTVVNTLGCRDSIAKLIEIKPAYVLYIPNTFTPNSDGLNDGFKALGIGITEFNLQIFDRWGKLVFESNNIETAWDGSINGKGDFEQTKQDVYTWKAQVKDVLLNQHDLIGHVTLLK